MKIKSTIIVNDFPINHIYSSLNFFLPSISHGLVFIKCKLIYSKNNNPHIIFQYIIYHLTI